MGIWTKIKGRSWLFHLFLIFIFLNLCILLTFGWLKLYTKHGQKLSLPDYEEQPLATAINDATGKSFEIIITDSIHDLDHPGGIILKQNPSPNATVKEGRKIYVTVSKYKADLIPLADLPSLYGGIYSSWVEMIKGYGLKTNILDYKYDPGPENSILEVWYRGEPIITREGKKKNFSVEKGSTLDFILAKSSGGLTDVPDLVCLQYSAAEFLADSYRLILEPAEEDIPIQDIENAYVVRQVPPPDGKLLMNEKVKVYLSSNKPSDCGNGFNPEN